MQSRLTAFAGQNRLPRRAWFSSSNLHPKEAVKRQAILKSVRAMLPPMQWDGLTLKAVAGVAAVIASGALLLAGVGLVVPMVGLVAGVAVMLGASLDRLKLRVEALEKMPRMAVAVKSGARIGIRWLAAKSYFSPRRSCARVLQAWHLPPAACGLRPAVPLSISVSGPCAARASAPGCGPRRCGCG